MPSRIHFGQRRHRPSGQASLLLAGSSPSEMPQPITEADATDAFSVDVATNRAAANNPHE